MAEYIYTLIVVGLLASVFAGLWKSFEKAGVDGWRALIPTYNGYLTVKIADLSGWLLLGFIIPIINIFAPVYIYYRFAKNYGKGSLFSILAGLFPFIALPVIGFDSSSYTGNYSFGEDDLA